MRLHSSIRPTVAACALALGSLLPGLQSASILFVSDNGPKGTQVGSDGVTRGAFYPAASTSGVPYVDQPFVDLLVAAGHLVTRYNPASTAMSLDDVPLINSHDLVIAATALNSGPFNLNSRGAKWNTMVTAPMIYTKSTLVRRDRTGFLLDNKEFDCAADASTTASGKWTLTEPNHPIFAGIPRSSVGGKEVMDRFANVRVATPANNRGTSIQYFRLSIDGVDQGIANEPEPGGRVLATIDFNPLDPGVNIPAGQAPAVNPSYVATGYAVVEWPAGTVVRTTQVPDGSETLAGYRLLFACGTRDASGSVTSSPNPQAGRSTCPPTARKCSSTRSSMPSASPPPIGGPTPLATFRGPAPTGPAQPRGRTTATPYSARRARAPCWSRPPRPCTSSTSACRVS